VDEADKVACITLAFGINKRFKDRIADNTPSSHITFFLLEKRDVKNPSATTAFVSLMPTPSARDASTSSALPTR